MSDRISTPDLSKLLKGAGATLSGSVGGRAISVLYMIFLAKWLGTGDLGDYVLGVTIVELLASICCLGFNFGLVRFIAINKQKGDMGRMRGCILGSLWITLSISLLVMGSLIALSGPLAQLFHKPRLAQTLSYMAWGLPFNSLTLVFLAGLSGLKMVQYNSIIQNFVCLGARFLFTLLPILIFGGGIECAVFAYIGSYILSAIVAFYYVNKVIPFKDRNSKVIYELREIVRFSIPMFLSVLLFNLMKQLDILLVGMFLTSSQVGIYSVAARLVVLGEVIFTSFRPIFDPFVAELYSLKDMKRLAAMLKTLISINFAVGLPCFLALLFFPAFFLTIFGKEFIVGAGCLMVLSVAHLFSSLSSLPASIIIMSGRSGVTVANNAIILVINVLLNLLLIPHYGLFGAALATSTGLTIISIVRFVEVYHWIDIHPFSRGLWKPVFAGLGAALVSFIPLPHGAGQIGNAAMLVMFFCIYFLLMAVLKARKDHEDTIMLIANRVKSTFKVPNQVTGAK
jgi:O-antigen/teichoic acid export membrane protein